MAIWPILHLFGIIGGFYVQLVYFSRFGMLYVEQSGNPGIERYRIYEKQANLFFLPKPRSKRCRAQNILCIVLAEKKVCTFKSPPARSGKILFKKCKNQSTLTCSECKS
jgi:hypothetical protein